MKCLILSRVSTLSQDLTQQTNELLKKANLLGYAADDIIIDEFKESAIKLSEEERQTLQKMKYHIENDDVDLVLIWEITRLSRKLSMLYDIRDYLQEHHVQLKCSTPEFTLFDSEWKISQASNIIFSLYAVLAESEMQIKKERFQRAKAKMRAENKYTGGKILFGYTVNEDKKFIVDPRQCKIVKRIFEWYSSGEYSGRQIADLLYKEGSINQPMKAARDVWVCKVLKNSAYTGDSYYPAIISLDTYNKAQTYLNLRQKKSRTAKENNIYLSHKLLFVVDKQIGDRQMLVRKSDAAYIDKVNGYCININMVDSLLLYCTDKSLNKHSDIDKKAYIRKLKNEMFYTSRRLITYNEKEDELIKKIDKIEERVIYGSLTEDKANKLEKQIKEDIEKLRVSRQKDQALVNILSKDLNAIQEESGMKYDIYVKSLEEQYKIVREEISKVYLERIKNGIYQIKVQYIHRLMQEEIYEVHSKEHTIYKDDEKIDIQIIRRYKRKAC